MQSNGCFLLCAVLLAIAKVTYTQGLQPPSEDASILLTALCLHDNRIRESCLQNVHMRDLLDGLLLSLSSPLRTNELAEQEDAQKLTNVPEKRRRPQDESRFYSNW